MTTVVVSVGWAPPVALAQPAAAAAAAAADTAATTATTAPTTAPHGATTTSTAGAKGTTTTAPTATSTTVAVPTTFPPGLLAIANSVRRTPPSNDAALLKALAPLEQLGYTLQQAEVIGMGQFPIGGTAFYSDDWLEPRPGNPPKLHEGLDIVAAMGTPIRSPIDGILKYDTSDPNGYGLAGVVTGPDKTYFVNGHMSATVTGLATGMAVREGQVIGFIGATGDATGPHDHFEVHPRGGPGVDPKPILDAWQSAAINGMAQLVRYLKGVPDSTVATVPPLQVALPTPQAGFSPPVPLPPTKPASTSPQGSLAGLALLALLALLASGSLAAAHHRPWRRPAGSPG